MQFFAGRAALPRMRSRALKGLLKSVLAGWFAAGAIGLAAASPGPAPNPSPTPEPQAGPAATVSTGTETETLQEVVVTGSRIPQPNLISVSPIQVVTSQEIQLQGTTNISDLINNLPQQFQNAVADFSATTNPLTGAGGISTADLRGLGPQRTLVLVDGRRLGVGDASTLNPNPAPDLNQIPAQLVERIDVVTGGASAVYGSDAIAGVVNFVMKKNFQGIQIDGQAGADQHNNHDTLMQNLQHAQPGFESPDGGVWDGQNRSLSLIMGANSPDDKGNVTAYFTYHDADPVSQGSRDFSACKLNVGVSATNPNIINTPVCNGSANSNIFEETWGPNAFSVVGNQLLPYPQAGSVPPPIFDSSPYQTLSSQDTRFMGGFFSHYDINDYVKPYLDFSFMNDRTHTQVGPAAAFAGGFPYNPQGTGGLLINCSPTNPLLSAQENAAICNPNNAPLTLLNGAPNTGGLLSYPTANGDVATDITIGRRNIEGGPRSSDYEHNNYRAVFGFTGEAGGAWTYDAYGSFYYTSLFQSNGGYLSYQKIQNALLVTTNPLTGAPQCQGGQTGCIPWNIWTQGGVTPAQTQYLATLGTSQGVVSERIVSANTTGQLGKYGITSPLATDGIAVNIGAEHRSDDLNYAPDAEELANDLAGFGGAGTAINNGYHVQEEFIELRAPLVQGKAWADQLTAGAAYRRSDYSTVGNVNTYKFDVEYAPIHELLVRASFDRAIRAPNIIELYTPQSVTNTSVVASDPCAGPNPTQSLTNCEHSGVTTQNYGHILQCPAGQCATLQGGNPDLQAETANTLSFGLTFAPTAYLNGFSASVDYYKIQVKQEIGNVPIDIALNQCLATGNPVFCNSVVRSPTGALFGTTIAGGGYIKGLNVNIAAAEVSGVDLQLAYRWDVGSLGKMSATFSGTYLDQDTSQPLPTEATYNCSGLYGPTCQTVNPHWRHIARLSWQTPAQVLVSAQWRFIGSVKLDNNTGNPELLSSAEGYGPGVIDTFDAKLPSVSYLDLSAIWDVSKYLSLRAGVNNVLDKDPPLVSSLLAGTGSPNSYPTYDLLGRVMFAAFTAKF